MTQTNHFLTTTFLTFECWLQRQENYLRQINEEDNRDETSSRALVTRILTHYREYYDMKSVLANMDVFLVISPPWLNTLEMSLLWIGGYKPSQVLRLAFNSVLDLTEEKKEEMEKFRVRIKVEERRLMSTLAVIHESMAMPSENGYFVADQLKSLMEKLYREANGLREVAVSYTLEKPDSANQKLKFFAAAIQLHLRVRAVGNQRDAERQTSRT